MKLAAVVQLGAVLLAAGFVYGAFSVPLSPDMRLAVLLTATMLAGPHVSPYDTLLPAVAATLFLLRMDWAIAPPGAVTVALAVWLAPLFNPPRAVPVGFATPFVFILFMVYAARLRQPGGAGRPTHAIKQPAAIL
ncbi:MAG TPA: hypothetical protein VGH36_04985 [Acetobacteraceae bacterium]